jgi:hypothetical protein
MIGEAAAILPVGLGQRMIGEAAATLPVGLGTRMIGEAAATLPVGLGTRMIGEVAAMLPVGLGTRMIGEVAATLPVGLGHRMIGEAVATLPVGFGTRMIGELTAKPLCAERECMEGAATALIADRARAEPRATHEIFNLDEDIWRTPQIQLNLLRRLTQKVDTRYNKSTEVIQEIV